jgi:predicted DNA-binding protein (MmcQ/YjbR family)
MNIQQLYEFCLSKKGVTEHFPFDKDTLVFKVGGKMFALTSLRDWEYGNPTINLKCNPELAIELRAKFDDILPGFHMSKKHWNTISINNNLPDKKILHFINHSYELVFSKLPKKVKLELE